MRADLLEAQAGVDWAIAQTEVLEGRIKAYVENDPCPVFSEIDPQTGNKLVKIQQRVSIPLVIGAEVGIVVHAIRASLDLLATTLAYRYGIPKPDDMYFPIVRGADQFASGKYKGSEFVKGLPQAQRTIIENLKPYKGGNDLLYSMHQMDITRKHRRLVLYGSMISRPYSPR